MRCCSPVVCSVNTCTSRWRYPLQHWWQWRFTRCATASAAASTGSCTGSDEPYAAISRLGRRLGDTLDPTHVLPVMVETIADALRLPYVAVELLSASLSPAAAHGNPSAGVALRLPLTHAGEHVGTLVIGARGHGEVRAAASAQDRHSSRHG